MHCQKRLPAENKRWKPKPPVQSDWSRHRKSFTLSGIVPHCPFSSTSYHQIYNFTKIALYLATERTYIPFWLYFALRSYNLHAPQQIPTNVSLLLFVLGTLQQLKTKFVRINLELLRSPFLDLWNSLVSGSCPITRFHLPFQGVYVTQFAGPHTLFRSNVILPCL